MLRAVANPAAGGQPGSFTSLTVSGLTAGRVVYTGTGGLLSASANLTYGGTDLQLIGGAMLSYNGGFVAGNNVGITWNGGDRGIVFDANGDLHAKGGFFFADTDAASQSATKNYGGTGAPDNAEGANGDFYFRSDGGALTTIYHKRTGTWTGVV